MIIGNIYSRSKLKEGGSQMPEIPEHIKRRMFLFFLETSVPRIIAEERKKRENNKDDNK